MQSIQEGTPEVRCWQPILSGLSPAFAVEFRQLGSLCLPHPGSGPPALAFSSTLVPAVTLGLTF